LFLFGKTNFYDSYKVDKIISTVGRSLKVILKWLQNTASLILKYIDLKKKEKGRILYKLAYWAHQIRVKQGKANKVGKLE